MSSIKEIPREEIPWYPTISAERCTGCSACMKFCPNGVYEMREGLPVVANPYNCVVGCSGCQAQCPERAISFPSLIELRELLRILKERYGKSKV